MNPAQFTALNADPFSASSATAASAPPGLADGTAPLLQTQNLRLTYGQTIAFENVNLSIPAQQVTALVGPSGCGKSSFLMSLNRLTELIPQARLEGKIRLGDWDVLHPKLDAIALRRRVGLILQQPNPFPLSIWKNLAFPLAEHGVRHRADQAHRIETALTNVGLWDEVKDRLKQSALGLSGGQQQRLCIARTLVLEPEVLLLDEPCSALDPLSSQRVEALIAQLRSRYTVIIVTHNLAQAKRLADQVAVFWLQPGSGGQLTGQLIEVGPTRQMFEQPQHRLTADYVQGVQG